MARRWAIGLILAGAVADLLPPDGLAQLRELRWVMGDEMVELAGIGWYRTGSVKRGLLPKSL